MTLQKSEQEAVFNFMGNPIAYCNSFTASVSFLVSLLFYPHDCLGHGIGSSRGHRLKNTGGMCWPGFALNPCIRQALFPLLVCLVTQPSNQTVAALITAVEGAHFKAVLHLFQAATGLDLATPQHCSHRRNTHLLCWGERRLLQPLGNFHLHGECLSSCGVIDS